MKLKHAIFCFQEGFEEFSVEFINDRVRVGSQTKAPADYDNSKKLWKPCVTHCKEVIDLARGKIKNSRNVNRAKATKRDKRLSRGR